LRTQAIQEPVFSVANTYFEGGDNDNGYGDYIFLVKHGQPSHNGRFTSETAVRRFRKLNRHLDPEVVLKTRWNF
jgi:hypothetical protein